MNRQAQSIFCDDIRQEIGGKQSFIGVYTSKMFVQEFPIILPKICLVISALTPIENPFKKMIFRVLKDDELFAEGTIEEEELEKLVIPDSTSSDGNPNLISSKVQFLFSPFQIDGPCTLKVRVITENEELTAPGLRIELGHTSI
jgi:hypothetical protein